MCFELGVMEKKMGDHPMRISEDCVVSNEKALISMCGLKDDVNSNESSSDEDLGVEGCIRVIDGVFEVN